MKKQAERNSPLIFLIGAACMVGGAGAFYIVQGFRWVPAITVVLGALLCFAHLQGAGKVTFKYPAVFLFRRGTWVFLLYTAIFSVFVCINYFGRVCNQRWDLTGAKQHTLSKSTADFIKGLTKHVQVTAFYVGPPPKYLEDLLEGYTFHSGGTVKTEIIDPLVQLGYAAQFGRVIRRNESKVIVQSGEERRDVDFSGDTLTEEALINAIIRVTRPRQNAYFLTGHGEYNIHEEQDEGFSTFRKMLRQNNVDNRRLLLGLGQKIPEDCDVLILAGPKNPLSKEEEGVIQDYLAKGGDALFLIEHTVITTPDKPLTPDEMIRNPSLNGILNQWGMKVSSDIVVDLGSHASGDVGSPATKNYLAHQSILGDMDYTFYIRPRSIGLVPDRPASLRATPLVLTSSSSQSWGETNRMLDVKYDAGEDRAGPVPIAFVAWQPRDADAQKTSDTRIAVFTDADFLSNAYITAYDNAEMGLKIVSWLTEEDYQVFVDQKKIKVERLNLTSRQKRVIAVILFAIPLMIAALGVTVWTRR